MAATTSVFRTLVSVALLGATTPLSTGLAAPPTTAPTTHPTEFPTNAPARTWFAQLASADPRERESAHDNLMGLTTEQLPMLRTLVQNTQPLLASQIAPLHDIVIQAFLSTERYPTEPAGFLGLRWSHDFTVVDEPMRLGVPVEVRLPGFPSYRALRDGDMIIGVLFEPDLPLDRKPNTHTPTYDDLTHAVGPVGPGRQIELLVLRAGEIIHVPIKLAAHPLYDLTANEALFAERERRAEDYWKSQFVPLLQLTS